MTNNINGRNGIGSLLQLQTYSFEDRHIQKNGVGNISFFKTSYEQHHPFYIENIMHTLETHNTESHYNPTVAKAVSFGSTVTFDVMQNGYDLIGAMYLQIDLPTLKNLEMQWKNNILLNMIEKVELKYDKLVIKTMDNHTLNIFLMLNTPSSKLMALNTLIGRWYTSHGSKSANHKTRYYMPMPFFKYLDVQQFFPTIFATHYKHDLKISITFKTLQEMAAEDLLKPKTKKFTPDDFKNGNSNFDCVLFVDHCLLSKEDRKQITRENFKLLMNVLPYQEYDVEYNQQIIKCNLENFQYNVKCFHIFAYITNPETLDFDKYYVKHDAFDYYPLNTLEFFMNGLKYDKHSKPMDAQYYRMNQYGGMSNLSFIYTYSFALDPRAHQPSGSLNMSQVNNCFFNITIDLNAKLYETPAYTQLAYEDYIRSHKKEYGATPQQLKIRIYANELNDCIFNHQGDLTMSHI